MIYDPVQTRRGGDWTYEPRQHLRHVHGGLMTDPETLWGQVSECFTHGDGSLPSIEITNIKPDEISAIYMMLRDRSQLVGGELPELWSRTEERSVPLESVPDPAALVAKGEVEAFHLCLGGIEAAGDELPVLGLFVWPDSIELDYRMGPMWTPARVCGFFELLRDCWRLASEAKVRPAELEGPPYPDCFVDTWRAYVANAKGR